MNRIASILILICITISTQLCAQNRIKAGKTYKSGETFSAPVAGLNMTIPDNWMGYLPQDTEILMLNSDTAMDARCMYFVNQADIKKIKSNWKKGFDLAPGLKIVTDGKIQEENGILTAAIRVTNNPQNKGFVLARCGEYGMCITVMMYTPAQFAENFDGRLSPLVDNIEFIKPIPRSIANEFNWQKELTGKYIFAYERDKSSKKESQIWLNLDGNFKSKISRTGMFKGSAGKYKGTKKGSYLIYNKQDDQPAKLVLFFKNLPEVTLPLEKRENQYYINNQVFYYSAQ